MDISARSTRSRLTYANVMATTAVFLALGGTSYAAIMITGSNIKDGTVRSRDIADGTYGVQGRDVKDGSLASIDLSSGTVLAFTDTAAEIASRLLTVDGTGSGVDADLLDNLNSSDLLSSTGEIQMNYSGSGLVLKSGTLTVSDFAANLGPEGYIVNSSGGPMNGEVVLALPRIDKIQGKDVEVNSVGVCIRAVGAANFLDTVELVSSSWSGDTSLASDPTDRMAAGCYETPVTVSPAEISDDDQLSVTLGVAFTMDQDLFINSAYVEYSTV